MAKRNKIKTLENKCSKLWKEICFLRDGKMCQVEKHFPFIKITHSSILQVDHCVTRANKHLFYCPDNGTVVCSACNGAKHWDNKSVSRAIDEIVKRREGRARFEAMIKLDQTLGPCLGWKKIWWLEEQLAYLERCRDDLR